MEQSVPGSSMRFLCVGQTKRSADLVELPVGERPLRGVTALLKKAGVQLQTCLFFEDMELEGGVRLSELVSRAIADSEREANSKGGPEDAFSHLVGPEREMSAESTASLASSSTTASSESEMSAEGATGLASRNTTASLPHPPESLPRGPTVWRVVGGENGQGIVVRAGESLKSDPLAERLAAGSLVEELQLIGVRLEYRKLSGSGPQTGWISTAVRGRELARTTLSYLDLNDVTHARGPPVALLFPGEGVQHRDMLAFESLEPFPEVRMLLDQAHRVLGYDVKERCRVMPEWLLAKTRHSQPLLFVASVAALLVLRSQTPEKVAGAGAVAGFGMGYYTALCAAGVLPFEDMLRLLCVRGEEMGEADARGNFVQMTVMGLSQSQVQALCEQAGATAGARSCVIAHHYHRVAFGVVGPEASLFRLRGMALDMGATGVGCNSSAVSSECHLMKPALPGLEAALAEALPKMKPPSCSVWSTTGAGPFGPGCNVLDIVADLKAHLTAPLYWDKTVWDMSAAGFQEFYDVSPRGYLKNMLYWINPRLECRAAEAVPQTSARAVHAAEAMTRDLSMDYLRGLHTKFGPWASELRDRARRGSG